jgi:RNA 3'-terminal phosphate cyclase-like protein
MIVCVLCCMRADIQVDTLRTATATMLQQFGLDDVIIKVLKRGAPPKGGGSVLLSCSVVKQLTPITITEVCNDNTY